MRPMTAVIVAAAIVCAGFLAKPATAETSVATTGAAQAGPLHGPAQSISELSIKPPFKVEIWVASAYGLDMEGTKTLIEDYLKAGLQALGDVEFMKFPEGENLPRPNASPYFRLRVWFTQTLKPDGNECFDTTVGVVVSKVDRISYPGEVILDTYGLAGIATADLESMSLTVASRLDVRILSGLRRK